MMNSRRLLLYICMAVIACRCISGDNKVTAAPTKSGSMFSDLMSSLFGSKKQTDQPNSKTTTGKPGGDSLKQVLTNMTKSTNATRDDSQLAQESSASPDSVTEAMGTSSASQQTTSSTTSTSSRYYLSTQYSSTYRLPEEEQRCYTDAVLQNFCPVPNDLTDVSFWDLYSVLFSDTVLDALMIGCTRGSWCLQDRFDYWDALIAERADMVTQSEISDSMCQPDIDQCITKTVQNFKNCSMYPQMEFTAEALSLICKLKQNKEQTNECFKHVITALHVSLADIMRREGDYISESDDTCESAEAYMTGGLICVENSCPGEYDTFNSFQPWSWFTKVVDELIEECDMDPSKCLALLQVGDHPSFTSSSSSSSSTSTSSMTSSSSSNRGTISESMFTLTEFSTYSTSTSQTSEQKPPPGYLYGSEMSTMIGVSVAITISAIILTLSMCVCYKRYRRNAVIKDGYQKLLNDGDES